MPRQSKKYHYIYKTTCKVNGKFYVGMHSTDNLEDGYMGSGKRIWYSLKKYGRENHVKEILEFLPDRRSLAKREKEIVNEKFIEDKNCMNIALGGGGGNHQPDIQRKWIDGGKKAFLKKMINEEFKKEFISSISKGLKAAYLKGKRKRTKFFDWNGKKHSAETKTKISIANKEKQKGKNNSQFGTIWITNGINNKKVNKDIIIPDGWVKGRK